MSFYTLHRFFDFSRDIFLFTQTQQIVETRFFRQIETNLTECDFLTGFWITSILRCCKFCLNLILELFILIRSKT